jgi:hypothetical protein
MNGQSSKNKYAPIQEFCDKRMVNPTTKEAFIVYVKASYSSSYAVKDGDTLTMMIGNMTQEKVEDMWIRFVMDFREILPTSS